MRLKIFYSVCIGVIVAFIITMMSGLRMKRNRLYVCNTALITNMAYILWPKGDYMIYHLTSEQKRAWFAIYNEMKREKNYRYGLG